ncbi:GNAT family N-acetyltransferase [Chelativorans salis]|uniref:GNAT family N-acetyltransferase n=1 Tax=Chelativorans salis TaxID=2978478 RepID=A0ABT2LWG5_9HYPH|nr:GNAT family protein [Chelativorans sp. EGI FJ00035]MCT7377539.1 GNAT family N-acetyltransferase [Chelativorans sp. EGI FJ00035]
MIETSIEAIPVQNLSHWTSRPVPGRAPLAGRYVRLEPLDPAVHGDGLFAASSVPDSEERFRWLGDYPPEKREAFQPWLEKAAASHDPLFFAVINLATGEIGGRQAFMRIDAANGVAEIGNIYWGPTVARTRLATEAFYLFARHIFDDLGYRRFEWKCNDRNEGSKRAALRFGFRFEGIFRQHMVVKGENRDTAWYAMLDHEWPTVRAALEAWLAPDNFDGDGRQARRLETIRETTG